MSQIGTLLPIFSLNPDDLLQSSQKFIDWLCETNQSHWQILPINLQPLGESSPYSSYSIGLQLPNSQPVTDQQRQTYLHLHPWLRDVSIFLALRDHFQTDEHWTWPDEFKLYQPHNLIEFSLKNRSQIQKHLDQQISSHILWSKIKSYANSKLIQIIGDLPFYIDRRSPLVWANQSLFTNIPPDSPWTSGVPSSSNYPRQVWNHPLYNWEHLQPLQYLWQLRIHHSHFLYDYLRIDHSIGFFHFGVMHTQDDSQDHIAQGPEEKIFDLIYQTAQYNKLKLIAEDITDYPIHQLHMTLNNYQIPSSRVFTQGLKHNHLDPYFTDPREYDPLTISYSSNHDTPPLMPWLASIEPNLLLQLNQDFGLKPNSPVQDLAVQIRTKIINSPAQIAIIPIQDWLLSDKRINTPGTPDNQNWQLKLDLSKLSIV